MLEVEEEDGPASEIRLSCFIYVYVLSFDFSPFVLGFQIFRNLTSFLFQGFPFQMFFALQCERRPSCGPGLSVSFCGVFPRNLATRVTHIVATVCRCHCWMTCNHDFGSHYCNSDLGKQCYSLYCQPVHVSMLSQQAGDVLRSGG